MRIAMISEHASPLVSIGGVDAGGQNIYVAQVARWLSKLGHQVDVFTRRDSPTLPTVVEAGQGLRVVHVDAGPHTFVPKEKLLDHMPQFAKFCREWMEASQPYDVVHANFFMSGWVGLRLKALLGLPLVTTFHALGLVRREHQKEEDTFPTARIDIERELSELSDVVIAECPQDFHDLQRLYRASPSRIAMVPCGFDRDEFQPGSRADARRRLGIPQDEFMILQVGRMVPRKGVETVVRAMAEPSCASMHLRIVGGDCEQPDPMRTPEIARLHGIASECGVLDRVTFQGCKRRDELRDWYAACDVFVTVPWYEPFGITPLEAMACARPVVGSAVGGVKYTVQDGQTGLLVPAKNPQALAQALATLQDDPTRARELGEAGFRRVQSKFTWEGVASSLADVFKRACVGTPSRAASIQVDLPRFHIVGGDPALPSAPQTGRLRKAIFLDKDGTLIEDVPYNVDPAKVRFTAHAFEALQMWRAEGYALVIVTNQPGLDLGMFDRAALMGIYAELTRQAAEAGIVLDGFFACPHTQGEGCGCRKPSEGLLTEAARILGIDLENSWMVGDILNDIEAGHRAGCRSVLLDVGNETEWRKGPLREPDLRCRDLRHAALATLRAGSAEPTRPDLLSAGASPNRKGALAS